MSFQNTDLYARCTNGGVLGGYRGSIAHNMYVKPEEPTGLDDKDLMFVVLPPADFYFGLKEFGSRGTQEIKQDEWDIVIYELRKFVRLLVKGNPNVISLLWLEPQHYVYNNEVGQMLLDARNLFSGRHVYRSFVGYAYAQLHKMTHMSYAGYMGAKRKALVDKFGHDTKNAAHLVRLLRMAIEFLKDGAFYVYRHDAPQLLEIKNGLWTLEQVKTEADRLFKLAEEAYLKSTLPVAPDAQKVADLLVNMVSTAWHIDAKKLPRWTYTAQEIAG